MNKQLNYIAAAEDEGRLLGAVIKERLGLTTRQLRSVKFSPNGITINGETYRDGRFITVRAAVRKGDRITVTFPEESETVEAVAGDLAIVYEDEDLVLINKPAGLVAHPAHGHYWDTLANRLAARYAEPVRLIGRLDKDTSGLIVAARSSIVATRMEEQRRQEILQREYVALVEGQLTGNGTIEEPIDGKPAKTDYQVWHTGEKASLVWLKLHTGRTHQIRIHMASLGHPLLGDSLYGNEGSGGFARAALHSWRIRGVQPFTGEPLDFQSVPPEDFIGYWENMMKIDYVKYMERLTFPKEAIETLLPMADIQIEMLGQRYMAGEITLDEALETLGKDEFGRYMIFLIGCLPTLRQRYAEKGLPDELFWHTMMDLKYKLMECQNVKKTWGTFVPWWNDGFYKMTRFALGRLQFEKAAFYDEEPYQCGGYTVKQGDTVINMHIPSSGPLTEDKRLDAYQKAYEFFKEEQREGVLPFVCNS